MNAKHVLLREIAKPAVLLTAFALVGTLILAGIHAATTERIANNERQALLNELNALVSPEHYDNDPLHDQISLPAAGLNSAAPITVYRARQQGQPVAALFVTTTPEGYSGNIKLLIAVNADQTLAGVRALNHKETPGLGDRIEVEKSDWILQFQAKSLDNPAPEQWAVRKDGGAFDQFTGATITPRAVVSMIKRVLLWSDAHWAALFQMPASEDSD
ncbi:MAG: electron transport complex subunit RsxG [Proteobacteria bacterium]|nr:MAG: electron transport complex subunit RsxG [Pseudomonadota bacterium]